MQKAKKWPIGKSDFKSVIEGDYVFIDKTLFIQDIMDDGAEVILITRPRRFGKTINMSMLSYFLKIDEDKDLFDGLHITQQAEFCEQHQNKYPVIFLSFKDVKAQSWEESFTKLKEVFSTLYKEHADLCEGSLLDNTEKEKFSLIRASKMNDPVELSYALVALTRYLSRKHGISPILLLDEYDTPIHSAYTNKYYAQIIDFMRTLLGSALKDNKDLEKAVMTGITRVAKESMFSGLNNLKVYTLLNPKYGQYFGFTEEEVRSLLPKNMDIAPIREWYNGYTIGHIQVYNPWSIINCLDNNGETIPYWVNTSDNALLMQLIDNSTFDLKLQFEELIKGHSIETSIEDDLTFAYIDKDDYAIWTLLLHAGYLNVIKSEQSIGRQKIVATIPNNEIRYIYNNLVQRWFINSRGGAAYDKFVNCFARGDVEGFAQHISSYIQTTASYFDFNTHTSEQVFHAFMLGLFVEFQYTYKITSNREAGLGRYDMVFVPHDTTKQGIVLEFKTCEKSEDLNTTAQKALEQITQKQYTEAFSQENIAEILCIGLAFCGKDMQVKHQIYYVK